MVRDGIAKEWIRVINGKPTFCGALEDLYDIISRHWNLETTRKNYDRDYNEKILPNLTGHDNKAIGDYTKEDYDEAIRKIISHGKSKEVFQPYAEGTINHFRYLIQVVVSAAADAGLCENVLWGSVFRDQELETEKNAVLERVTLKKSLTVRQEQHIAELLLQDIVQTGQRMGLLMMFALGLRNGEVCGLNYGDIRPMDGHPECMVLWVYKATIAGTSTLKASGKTRNADRIIPMPEVLVEFLDRRRAYLQHQITFPVNEDIQTVDDLPIACVGDRYTERCSAQRLTSAGRELFRTMKEMNEHQLIFMDEALSDEAVSTELREKDPTAYLFRRNFGTHLHILGLTESEIEYVIGHDIQDAYETRNEFISPEKLYEIKEKLDQRPIFNRSYLTEAPVTVDGTDSRDFSAEHSQTFRVNGAGKAIFQVEACEPGDSLTLRTKAQGHIVDYELNVTPKDASYDRTIHVLKQYQGLYRRKEPTANRTE